MALSADPTEHFDMIVVGCGPHRRHGKHFGLYFTFWGRMFGTEDPADAVSQQPAAMVPPEA